MLGALLAIVTGANTIVFDSAPGPLDNPLKGWALYSDSGTEYSVKPTMAYFYVSWRELEPEPGKYQFDAWEKRTWDNPAARGKHIIFRLYLEYPTLASGLPKWIIDQGIKRTPYTAHGGGLTPDYDDPRILKPLLRLISAMGTRYNKNPRVAFVPIGTLGHWGEWHTYPDEGLFASAATQRKVVEAWRAAFPDKKLLARYPYQETSKPWLGYHDDYFPLDTGEGEPWQFMSQMKAAKLTQNWRSQVFGAEMVPNEAERFLGKAWDLTKRMTEAIHLTWMGPYAPPLESGKGSEFQSRQEWLTRRMGYEFQLLRLEDRGTSFALEGVNRGVAPFYYPWKVEVGWYRKGEGIRSRIPAAADLRTWLPGRFAAALPMPPGRKPGDTLALGIVDPWTKRPAIRFANRLRESEGWTLLGN